jgi:hypothetical protein
MDVILARLRQQGMPSGVGTAPTLEEKKESVLNFLNEQQKVKETEIKSGLNSQHMTLFKSAVKWILGALVSGFLFINFWRNTRWTRKA